MARVAVSKIQVRKAGNFTVQGYDEIIDNVNRILDQTQSKNLKAGFMKGAMLIRDAGKVEAPFDAKRKSGDHLRTAIFAAPGDAEKSDALVGVSRSKRKTGSPSAPHGLLVHEGTAVRHTKKGANRGKVNPDPFMKRAIARTKGPVAVIIAETMQSAVFNSIK